MDEMEQPAQQQLNSKMDFELDERYRTEYTAYDLQTNQLVTAADVMFGDAKGHEVIPLAEAIGKIREDLDKSIKSGNLKAENTEGVLIDIRQALNQCDQAKNKALKDAEGSLKDLIKVLYERKDQVINDINEYFTKERGHIEEQEHSWREKQAIAQNLLKMTSSKEDDQSLLENSKYIAEGINLLSEKSKFADFRLIESLDTVMHVTDEDGKIKKADISHEELKRLICQYIQPCEYKKIQYRC
jgi:hypothetical protein